MAARIPRTCAVLTRTCASGTPTLASSPLSRTWWQGELFVLMVLVMMSMIMMTMMMLPCWPRWWHFQPSSCWRASEQRHQGTALASTCPSYKGKIIIFLSWSQFNKIMILLSPSSQSNYWRQVQFIMSDDTRLSDLLSLNLHNFEDEVWMIAQHIAHMSIWSYCPYCPPSKCPSDGQ